VSYHNESPLQHLALTLTPLESDSFQPLLSTPKPPSPAHPLPSQPDLTPAATLLRPGAESGGQLRPPEDLARVQEPPPAPHPLSTPSQKPSIPKVLPPTEGKGLSGGGWGKPSTASTLFQCFDDGSEGARPRDRSGQRAVRWSGGPQKSLDEGGSKWGDGEELKEDPALLGARGDSYPASILKQRPLVEEDGDEEVGAAKGSRGFEAGGSLSGKKKPQKTCCVQ